MITLTATAACLRCEWTAAGTVTVAVPAATTTEGKRP